MRRKVQDSEDKISDQLIFANRQNQCSQKKSEDSKVEHEQMLIGTIGPIHWILSQQQVNKITKRQKQQLAKIQWSSEDLQLKQNLSKQLIKFKNQLKMFQIFSKNLNYWSYFGAFYTFTAITFVIILAIFEIQVTEQMFQGFKIFSNTYLAVFLLATFNFFRSNYKEYVKLEIQFQKFNINRAQYPNKQRVYMKLKIQKSANYKWKWLRIISNSLQFVQVYQRIK